MIFGTLDGYYSDTTSEKCKYDEANLSYNINIKFKPIYK